MGFVAGRLMTNTKQRSFENVQEQLKDSITFKAEEKVILEKIVPDVDASERGNVYQGSETELYNMYSSHDLKDTSPIKMWELLPWSEVNGMSRSYEEPDEYIALYLYGDKDEYGNMSYALQWGDVFVKVDKIRLEQRGLEVGATLMSGENAAPEVGNALPLKNIPIGTVIHNIELRPGQGAFLVRSAGTFAQLTSREGDYAIIKLPSGETRKILATCKATIGSVGNSDHALERSGKAGRSRWLGRRPRNRGVVMNPVDHPMGGGEGRASGGHPRSRKGLYAKGLKTRAPKKHSSKYIIERRKK